MLLFIDESGDWGMKSKASARNFTLAAVLFKTIKDADACEEGIRQLRQQKGWSADFWFHFTHLSDKSRNDFFNAVAPFDFSYVASTLDKTRLKKGRWKSKEYFYDEACRRLVDALEVPMRSCYSPGGKPTLGEAFISATDEAVYIRLMQDHLQRLKADNGRPFLKKAKPKKSKTSSLLQLADMVCGAVACQQNHGRGEFRKMIRAKEGKVVVWP
jgi:hypothetical protein